MYTTIQACDMYKCSTVGGGWLHGKGGTGIIPLAHVGVVTDVDSQTHSECDHRKLYGVEWAIFPE